MSAAPASIPATAVARPLMRTGRRVISWLMFGLLLGSLAAAASAWFLNDRITDAIAAQTTARAIDHTQMGMLARLTPSDFAPPHTPEMLAATKARLDPILAHLDADGSGVLDIELIAPDGIIVYSRQPEQAGQRISPDDQDLLYAALDGRVARKIDARASRRVGRNRRDDFAGAVDIGVPIRIDNAVVGAYEIDAPLPAPQWDQPLELTLAGGGLALLTHAVHSLLARIRRPGVRESATLNPQIEPNAVPNALRAPSDTTTGQLKTQTAMGALTRRELDVLRLLVDGRSYRGIADQLVLSEETVRSHVKHILHKMQQIGRTGAVAAALRAGWLEPESDNAPPAGTSKLRLTRAGETLTAKFARAGVARDDAPPLVSRPLRGGRDA